AERSSYLNGPGVSGSVKRRQRAVTIHVSAARNANALKHHRRPLGLRVPAILLVTTSAPLALIPTAIAAAQPSIVPTQAKERAAELLFRLSPSMWPTRFNTAVSRTKPIAQPASRPAAAMTSARSL